MARLIAWNLMTLDGFFEGRERWSLDFHEIAWGDELERLSLDQLATADALLFGRVTFEGMAAYWKTAKGTIADFMNRLPKVVFSRTLRDADWRNSRVAEDAVREVPRLKAENARELYIFGSAKLCDSLLHAGLIDEYRIALVPVVLGEGTPLWKSSSARVRMSLLNSRALANGCVILRYAPSGPGASGSPT
jgi:dihydrofolate reductase